jgi:hypothetical protein
MQYIRNILILRYFNILLFLNLKYYYDNILVLDIANNILGIYYSNTLATASPAGLRSSCTTKYYYVLLRTTIRLRPAINHRPASIAGRRLAIMRSGGPFSAPHDIPRRQAKPYYSTTTYYLLYS